MTFWPLSINLLASNSCHLGYLLHCVSLPQKVQKWQNWVWNTFFYLITCVLLLVYRLFFAPSVPVEVVFAVGCEAIGGVGDGGFSIICELVAICLRIMYLKWDYEIWYTFQIITLILTRLTPKQIQQSTKKWPKPVPYNQEKQKQKFQIFYPFFGLEVQE